MQLRFALRCVPVGAFLPSATGTWQAWSGPPSKDGTAAIHDLPTQVGDGQILRLDCVLFVVLGIAGVFVWVYLPPR
jgi:hypothetical protein